MAKKTNTVTESSKTSTSFHECNKEYLGQNIKMRFKLDNGNYEWYEGQILQFDPTSGKYGAFFPCDGQTVYYIDPVKEKGDIIFSYSGTPKCGHFWDQAKVSSI